MENFIIKLGSVKGKDIFFENNGDDIFNWTYEKDEADTFTKEKAIEFVAYKKGMVGQKNARLSAGGWWKEATIETV